jgi:hypothetical protein
MSCDFRGTTTDDSTRGYFASQAMFMQIWHNGYWWPHIREQIWDEILNSSEPQGYHPLQSIPAAKAMDHVQVDLIVGIPKSKEGFATIAVSKDIHTRYVWLYHFTTRGATEVAEALMKVMNQFVPN